MSGKLGQGYIRRSNLLVMLFLLLSPFFLPALSTIIEAMRNEVEEALAYARQAVYLARPRDMPEDVQTLLLEALRVTSVKLERL